jgi:hypothetical protein
LTNTSRSCGEPGSTIFCCDGSGGREQLHDPVAWCAGGHKRGPRGDHRDPTWWRAISEAAPHYLGVGFPESVWPKQRPTPGRLTEVEACHWPHSFRELIAARDPRLQHVPKAV